MTLIANTSQADDWGYKRTAMDLICPGMIFLSNDTLNVADGMVISVEEFYDCLKVKWIDLETSEMYEMEISELNESIIADWLITPD